MTNMVEELYLAALQLTEREREVLADLLVDSIQDEAPNLNPEWNIVIAQRLEDMKSGKAKTFTLDEVKLRLQDVLQSGNSTHG